MSNVERRWWPPVREALLDLAWRDKYTRWYLILMCAWYFGVFTWLLRVWPDLAMIAPVIALVGQWLIGRVIDQLKWWNDAQQAYDEEMKRDL